MIRSKALEFVRRCCGYRFPRLGRQAVTVSRSKLAPERVHTELLPGISAELDLSDEVQRATYWQGERFEYPALQILNEWISSGATQFFDIGSNYGFFSYLPFSHAIRNCTLTRLSRIRRPSRT